MQFFQGDFLCRKAGNGWREDFFKMEEITECLSVDEKREKLMVQRRNGTVSGVINLSSREETDPVLG